MRIGLVNDCALVLEAVRRTIESSGHHEIAWLARDGSAAVTACARDKPDLVLMDLMMAPIDGVEATRRIMAATPCMILIVTASPTEHVGKIFEALGAGAFDAVSTPSLTTAAGAAALLGKLRTLGLLVRSEKAIWMKKNGHARRAEQRLVVIGASAGGPAAVAAILSALPRDFPAPIVLAQHVDAQFAGAMADWLNLQSTLPVRVARDGEQPLAGEVLLAGENAHLVFDRAGSLRYETEPAHYSYRPSIDLLFQSVLTCAPDRVAAVLLSGMGCDGAKGMKALRDTGGVTIVQDEATSVVFGMPKAAIRLDGASKVLPLPQIAPALIDFAQN